MDADVTLLMLAQNDITHLKPSYDPWIPATGSGTNGSITVYFSEQDATLMACTDQYQICNPNVANKGKGCTNLTGSEGVVKDLEDTAWLDMNPSQVGTALRFMDTSIFRSMYYSVVGRDASALNGKNMHCWLHAAFRETPKLIDLPEI
jgi:hypothetical protein